MEESSHSPRANTNLFDTLHEINSFCFHVYLLVCTLAGLAFQRGAAAHAFKIKTTCEERECVCGGGGEWLGGGEQ